MYTIYVYKLRLLLFFSFGGLIPSLHPIFFHLPGFVITISIILYIYVLVSIIASIVIIRENASYQQQHFPSFLWPPNPQQAPQPFIIKHIVFFLMYVVFHHHWDINDAN